MKKVISFLLLSTIFITSLSCNKDGSNIVNTGVPDSSIDPSKAVGITSIAPNAYKSLGTLSRITDNTGKNRVVELDNTLIFKKDNANISYYSFRVGVKIQKTSDVTFFLDDKEIKKVDTPKEEDIIKMKVDSLKNTGMENTPAVFSDETKEILANNGAVFWEEKALPTGEISYSFLIQAKIIPSPRELRDRTKLHFKLKSSKTYDDWIELVKSPIHIATIGDSVMWGQGMSEEEHLMTKISKKLAGDKNQIIRLVNYARSGARMGDPNDNKDIDLYGEIPSASPSINAQLKRLIEDYKPKEGDEKLEQAISPQRIDLLVMDAGINNLGSSYILLGLDIRKLNIDREKKELVNNSGTINLDNKNIKDIAEKVFTLLKTADVGNKRIRDEINKVYCYNEAKNDFSLCNSNTNFANFLEEARRKLPNAQIMAMGYFPLLTKDTNIYCDAPISVNDPAVGKDFSFDLGAKGLIGMLTYFAVEPTLGDPYSLLVSGVVSKLTMPISDLIKKYSVERSTIWTNQSNMVINRAVETVMAKKEIPGRGMVRFVPVSHKFEKNPIFSKESYLWGIAQNKCQVDGAVFAPEDLVIEKRKEECDKFISQNKGSKFYCNRVSLFHPNTRGFDNGYLPEITKYMETGGGILSRDDL
ncbi:MAG: hypothetical protein U0457_12905 [Candidatus Sericytochromatia bacterium]